MYHEKEEPAHLVAWPAKSAWLRFSQSAADDRFSSYGNFASSSLTTGFDLSRAFYSFGKVSMRK